jgi:hypothetical protein
MKATKCGRIPPEIDEFAIKAAALSYFSGAARPDLAAEVEAVSGPAAWSLQVRHMGEGRGRRFRRGVAGLRCSCAALLTGC